MYFLKKLKDFSKSLLMKNDDCLSKDQFYINYLKKNKNYPFNILMEINGKLKKIDGKEFYEIFDVEYFPNLYFDNLNILKKISNKCYKNYSKGNLIKSELWLGHLHGENISNGNNGNVYIKWVNETREYGLFALIDIKPNEFIVEYTGRVRKHKRALDKKNSYCFEYPLGDGKNSSYTIDAKNIGNYARFINHSEENNLSPYAVYFDKIMHIILKSNKFIPKDTELTYNYGPKYWLKRENPEIIK